MEESLKKINGNLIEIKSKLDKDTFHISNGTGNIGQLNNYTLENKSIPKKLNNDTVEFKAHSLANYGQIFIIFKNAAFILLIIAIASINYVYVPADQNKKAILIFFLIIGALCAFLILYTVVFVRVKLCNDFIKVNNKDYYFEKIRKIKFCRSFFYFGKNIKIYLEDDKYPSLTLYLNNSDDMDLAEEFYLDYLKGKK